MGKFKTNGSGIVPKDVIFSGKVDGDKIIIDWSKEITKNGEKYDLSQSLVGGVMTTIPKSQADRYVSTFGKVSIVLGALAIIGVGVLAYKKIKR